MPPTKKVKVSLMLALLLLGVLWAGGFLFSSKVESGNDGRGVGKPQVWPATEPVLENQKESASIGTKPKTVPDNLKMGGPLMAARAFEMRTALLNDRSLDFLGITTDQKDAVNKLIREAQAAVVELELKTARIEREDGNKLFISYDSHAGVDVLLNELTASIKSIVPEKAGDLIHAALAYSTDFHSFPPGGQIQVSWNDGQFTFLMADDVHTEQRYSKWRADKGILEEDMVNFPRWAHIPRLFEAPVKDN